MGPGQARIGPRGRSPRARVPAAAKARRPARAGRRESAEVRIVGGRLKGRALAAPSSRAIRPTSERLRESIFDILEHRFPGQIAGARVVDLFAGTGALAIEALSRGARFALLVDNAAQARALLRANVEALALGGVTRIWRADATKLGKAPAGGPFALAFLDPPYGQGLAEPALASLAHGGWLGPDALVVAEEAAEARIAAPAGLALIDERVYGDTRIAIFQTSAATAI
ncbi:MAG TPA: 16S rRNA (guanine(966)-N(2))-methyltransferase RsmD [Roseiarcus sp.]|jgi:16S rRNA (guanine966-N2)-methyltransferase|nr:16S rRNA (guanine(966)-N(2))-methyltransferase RsmD [Roseiarcus sp.]